MATSPVSYMYSCDHWVDFRIPLIIFCNKSSASLNEVVVGQSEEVHKGSSTHTSLGGGGNKVLHLRLIIDDSNIKLLFNR